MLLHYYCAVDFFCVQKIQILCIFCSRQKEIMFSQFVLFGLGDCAEEWSQFSGINGTVMNEDHHFQFILKNFFGVELGPN